MADWHLDNYTHSNSSIFYSATNIPGPGVVSEALDASLCAQCACEGQCGGGGVCACVQLSGGRPNYINKLLSEEKLTASGFVLECNETCSCPPSCGNRLVQLGPLRCLTVYDTRGRGYGLKTEACIRRGTFICEYAGEVIGREEARRRARHDATNYIFVLKEHFSNFLTETIVDPTCIGNIGRYINHSCQPNAAIVPVRVDSFIPKLAVFATVDIANGEEITYNYSSEGTELGTVKCLCGTNVCKGFLPFDKDLLK